MWRVAKHVGLLPGRQLLCRSVLMQRIQRNVCIWEWYSTTRMHVLNATGLYDISVLPFVSLSALETLYFEFGDSDPSKEKSHSGLRNLGPGSWELARQGTCIIFAIYKAHNPGSGQKLHPVGLPAVCQILCQVVWCRACPQYARHRVDSTHVLLDVSQDT